MDWQRTPSAGFCLLGQDIGLRGDILDIAIGAETHRQALAVQFSTQSSGIGAEGRLFSRDVLARKQTFETIAAEGNV